jgi:hypothetical protein
MAQQRGVHERQFRPLRLEPALPVNVHYRPRPTINSADRSFTMSKTTCRPGRSAPISRAARLAAPHRQARKPDLMAPRFALLSAACSGGDSRASSHPGWRPFRAHSCGDGAARP